jgi:myo-inositol 2-dehydrogenase/D-chiro-inositol 1-dehydrogenase
MTLSIFAAMCAVPIGRVAAMSIRVAVIGTGNIGTTHARNLQHSVSGAEVIAVYDYDTQRALDVATEIGCAAYPSFEAVVDSPEIDAVVIASPDGLHAEQAIAALHHGKWILCEKPLAPTVAEAQKVMDAEIAFGHRRIQMGFMRRFDPGYLQLKAELDSGAVGDALLLHCVHRNPQAPYVQDSAVVLTNSVVHEIDINRWLLGEEYASVTIVAGRATPRVGAGVLDPMLVLFTTESGVVVEVESFTNCQYGYEVRCEVVASEGTIEMGDGSFVSSARDGRRGAAIAGIWTDRFDDAYLRQMQAWINDVSAGVVNGPTTWDGFAAAVTAETAVRALSSRTTEPVRLPARPALYS